MDIELAVDAMEIAVSHRPSRAVLGDGDFPLVEAVQRKGAARDRGSTISTQPPMIAGRIAPAGRPVPGPRRIAGPSWP